MGVVGINCCFGGGGAFESSMCGGELARERRARANARVHVRKSACVQACMRVCAFVRVRVRVRVRTHVRVDAIRVRVVARVYHTPAHTERCRTLANYLFT